MSEIYATDPFEEECDRAKASDIFLLIVLAVIMFFDLLHLKVRSLFILPPIKTFPQICVECEDGYISLQSEAGLCYNCHELIAGRNRYDKK